MRDTTSTMRSGRHPAERAAGAAAVDSTNEQHLFVRGLTNGFFLSLAIWFAAGYLTFILR